MARAGDWAGDHGFWRSQAGASRGDIYGRCGLLDGGLVDDRGCAFGCDGSVARGAVSPAGYYERASGRGDDIDMSAVRAQYVELGPMSFAEKIVLADFVLLAFLWLSRRPIQIGDWTLPGWSQIFESAGLITDGSVAMAMALILFVVPARDGARTRVMNWQTAGNLPWHIVLLIGGGFALASGFKESGLSLWCAQQMESQSATCDSRSVTRDNSSLLCVRSCARTRRA